MTKKSHDAVYVERYTDRDGNEKKRYTNIGALFTREDGSMSAKLESIPVNFSGWISFYVPKPKEQTTRAQQTSNSSDDEELPF